MEAGLVRDSAVAGLVAIALTGCGNTPIVSANVPNWPQSSGTSAEETRAIREREMARYRTSPEDNKMSALASSVAGKHKGVPTSAPASSISSGPAVAKPPGTPAASSPRVAFEVPSAWSAQKGSPELANRPAASPPPERLALAAPSTAGSQQTARYGDLLFISGQLPVDSRGQPTNDSRFEEQARLVLENVKAQLATNRLTMANVVSLTVHLRNLDDLAAFDAVYSTYFKGALPARSVVEVSRLPNNARVQVSAVAGR